MPETLAEPRTQVFYMAAPLPRDEINPDTLTSTVGMLIGALEESIEASNGAANWETLSVKVDVAAFDAPEIGVHENQARVYVSVRAL